MAHMVLSDPQRQQKYKNLLAEYLHLSSTWYLNPTRKALEHLRNEEENGFYELEEKLKLYQDVFSQSYQLGHHQTHNKDKQNLNHFQ